MERLGSFYRILTALALMGCLSLGYYEDVFFENLFDNMDLVESYEVEKEKEEKETEKEKEIGRAHV